MVMFDSLNRHMLSPYGCAWTHTPNFQRLARQTVTFDRSYVCSMPCMPARRDLHTGRPNFLHRSWGPLEPFDDSVPEMLKRAGVYTHLTSDHYHYWEEGGCTYHTRYSSWEFFRGQEGDPWFGQVELPPTANAYGRNAATDRWHAQDPINRAAMPQEHPHPQARTMRSGMEFIRRNADADNWFLQIETFDPHEPFFSHRIYKDNFPEHYAKWREKGNLLWDWPTYHPRDPENETDEMVEHMRHEYASLLAMCDAKLGSVLDMMDELDMWDDTMLIVWTDHGFMLGEHDCWAKMWMPFYEEVAHTPFFIWDPRCGKQDERRQALVQPSIDLGPTLLEFFGVEQTDDMLGQPLAQAVADDTPVRDAGIFGIFGGQVNVTDGRYVYMRAGNEKNSPLNDYTLMPTNMRHTFGPREFDGVTLAEPFNFTKGVKTMKLKRGGGHSDRDHADKRRHVLYDLQTDPGQTRPMVDDATEQRMIEHLVTCMQACDAPQEQYERLSLNA